jgi:hypothetical protein
MQSAFRNAVTAVGTTLAIAFASLLLAALVFLYDLNPSEPPAAAVLVGVGSFLVCECVVLRGRRVFTKAAAIVLGAVLAWILSPEVGGRFDSKVDELFSTDRLHFGVVTLTIAGGAIGSIVESLLQITLRVFSPEAHD